MKKCKYLATELLVSLHKLVSGWLHCSVVGRCSQKLSEVSFGEKGVLTRQGTSSQYQNSYLDLVV